MSKGTVLNIQRYSLHDGPGIRSTVFFKGCPLACLWCHNPESQSPLPVLLRKESLCVACSRCPPGPDGGKPVGLPPQGMSPGHCPSSALETVGREYSPDELIAEAVRDRAYFDESGGGITFSGGEPLAQPAFLFSCMEACRRQGIHTVLDTSGHANWLVLKAAAGLSDIIFFDIKAIDTELHKRLTGKSSELILENLTKLAEGDHDIRIRFAIIPGMNDSDDNLTATASFLAELPRRFPVDILPYHNHGEAKYSRLGRDYALKGTKPPSGELLERAASIFRVRGLETIINTTEG